MTSSMHHLATISASMTKASSSIQQVFAMTVGLQITVKKRRVRKQGVSRDVRWFEIKFQTDVGLDAILLIDECLPLRTA